MTLLSTRQDTDACGPADSRHCVFRVGRTWYSIAATLIREIAAPPPIVPIPGCHGGLAGICHLRSQLVPVLRLEQLLGNRPSLAPVEGKLIVIAESTGDWALLVEEVSGLESLHTFVSTEGMERDGRAAVMLGTATLRDEVVNALDPKKLYRLAQQSFDEAWAASEMASETPATKS